MEAVFKVGDTVYKVNSDSDDRIPEGTKGTINVLGSWHSMDMVVFEGWDRVFPKGTLTSRRKLSLKAPTTPPAPETVCRGGWMMLTIVWSD